MPTAEKTDPYELHKNEYVTPKKPVLLDVQPAYYLSIAGTGLPGGEEFQSKAGALYGTAFTLKFASKFEGRDYSVCKLEGIYWTDEGGPGFATIPMDQWHWDLIIRTPEFVTELQLSTARQKMLAKDTPDAADVKFQTIHEASACRCCMSDRTRTRSRRSSRCAAWRRAKVTNLPTGTTRSISLTRAASHLKN